jgi:hypothetical protein
VVTNFEFNASIYYIIRHIGFWLLATTSYITEKSSHYSFYFSSYINLLHKNKTTIDLFHSFIIVLTLYFLSSTTVHPWYIINLIIGVFTKYKFQIVWVVILSYSAYVNPEFKENFWLIGLEYFVVFAFLIYENWNYFPRKTVYLRYVYKWLSNRCVSWPKNKIISEKGQSISWPTLFRYFPKRKTEVELCL